MQAYLELKLAWELFQRAPHALNDDERKRVGKIALRQQQLEQAILTSREAAQASVPDATLNERLATLRSRYPTQDELDAELGGIGLNEDSLCAAILRDQIHELRQMTSGPQEPPL